MDESNQQSVSVTLKDLPSVALAHVLGFLRNIQDLLRCERVCRALHEAVSTNDTLWQKFSSTKPPRPERPFDERFKTYRELACVNHNLRLIRRHQKRPSNALLDIFPEEIACARWKSIIFTVLEKARGMTVAVRQKKDNYILRGDTLGTLVEILHTFLITNFQLALNLAIEFCNEDSYPCLELKHLRLQEKSRLQPCIRHSGPTGVGSGFDDADYHCKCFFQNNYTDDDLQFSKTLNVVGRQTLDWFSVYDFYQMIRQLAFRAGVVKMENAVVIEAWMATIKLIVLLFYRPLLSGELDSLRSTRLTGTIMSHQEIRNVEPHTKKDEWDRELLVTPVPRQLEDIAQAILPALPMKIYSFWLTDSTGALGLEVAEIAEAEKEYTWLDEDGSILWQKDEFHKSSEDKQNILPKSWGNA